jgi:hypothetical protein
VVHAQGMQHGGMQVVHMDVADLAKLAFLTAANLPEPAKTRGADPQA